MSDPSPGETHPEASAGEPSSVLWSELFFDLVAVAAMVVLATALEHHATWTGIGVFSITFTAIWMCWSSIALYVNAADDRVERGVFVLCMAAIAVMASSLLDIVTHANTFAIAFLACRTFTYVATVRSGRAFPGWATLVAGANVPWIASLVVPGNWKFVLWGVGLAIDLFGLLRNAGTGRATQRAQRQVDRGARRREQRAERRLRRGRGPARTTQVTLVAAPLRPHHLSERLGTFVIIVLGESVLQLVRAASETEWSTAMWVAAAAAFGIIVAIWRQTFVYGFSSAPRALEVERKLPTALIVHLVTAGSLVVMAAGLGELVRITAEPEESLAPWAYIATGGLAVYLLTSIASALLAGANGRWILRRSLPAAAAVVVLGVFGTGLPAWAFVLLLAFPVGWLIADRGWSSARA